MKHSLALVVALPLAFGSCLATAQGAASADAEAALAKRPAVVLSTAMDLEELEVGPALSEFLSQNQGLLGHTKPAPLAYAAAMDRLRSLTKSASRAKELAAIRAHPQLQTPDALIAAAAGAVLRGAVRDAADRMLIAAERWPDSPEPLFNLAALLAQQGLPNEALALVNETERRGKLPDPGFDLSPQSAVQYVRAYSLMQLGQYKDAAALLRPIVKREEDFAEAALTLALLEDKLGGNPRPAFLQGVWRRSKGQMTSGYGKAVDARDPMTGESPKPAKAPKKTTKKKDDEEDDEKSVDDVVSLSAEHSIDLSRGRPGVLLSLFQPTKIEDYVKYWAWMKGSQSRLIAETESLGQRALKAEERWRGQKLSPAETAWLEAHAKILSPGNARLRELQARYQRRDAMVEDKHRMDGIAARRFEQGFEGLMQKAMAAAQRGQQYDICPELRTLVEQQLAASRVQVQAVDQAERHAYRLWHRYATALGANVGNRAFRDYVKAVIEFENFSAYNSLLANMYEPAAWAEMYEGTCPPPPPAPVEAAKKPGEEDLAACSDEEARRSRGFSLADFVSVEKTCNGMSVSLNLRIVELSGSVTHDRNGWIQERKVGAAAGATDILSLSGEVGSNKKGETTIYVGPKAGGKIGAGPASAEASHQGGVYLTTKNGEMTDWGVKSVTTAKASSGSGSIGKSVEKSVSFVPGPARPGSLQPFTPRVM